MNNRRTHAGTLIPNVTTVSAALMRKATRRYRITCGISSASGHNPVVCLSQGAASSNNSSVTASFVYLFQKLTNPVIRATSATSAMGYAFTKLIRRKLVAQKREALMNSAPSRPPAAPRNTKLNNSKKRQSVV